MDKQKQKIILGIDPGIADTGFGIVVNQNNNLTCITYGSIKTLSKTDLADRLEITVPTNEPSGNKSSIIYFISSLGE